jgi:transcriptional regulator with XRE-family HTH domain
MRQVQFPSKLRDIRERHLLTQANLEQRSGVCARTIHAIEQGTTNPRLPTRRKLLAVFDIPFTDHEGFFGAPLHEEDSESSVPTPIPAPPAQENGKSKTARQLRRDMRNLNKGRGATA